jgi:hypothetical protein
VKTLVKKRFLLAVVCMPVALAACDPSPGDEPPKPRAEASANPVLAAKEPLTTGPAGTAYPVPSVKIEPERPEPPAAQAPAAASGTAAGTRPGGAQAGGSQAGGPQITGSAGGASSNGTAQPAPAPATSAAAGVNDAKAPAGASADGKDTAVNAPGTGVLTDEEEKNQMPMAGQNHNYSGDARKAGQNEATPTGKNDGAASVPANAAGAGGQGAGASGAPGASGTSGGSSASGGSSGG